MRRFFPCAVVLIALLVAADPALAAPRRALLVTKEAGVAVDPVGVVRSTVVSTSINLNFFCEFIKPMLDFELPPTYC